MEKFISDKVTFSSESELSEWMSRKGNPEELPAYGILRYYKIDDLFYSVRYYKKRKIYEVRIKKLKSNRYLTYNDGGSHSAITIASCRNEKLFKKANYRTKWYVLFFNDVVRYLVSKGVDEQSAKDYAQDAFLKISADDYISKIANQSHFVAIWRRRGWWDYLENCHKICFKNRSGDIPDYIPLLDKDVELRLGYLLSAQREREVVNNILSGFSITDIAEMTGQSFASVSSARNRAVAKLKKMNL